MHVTFGTVNKFDLGKLEQTDLMCFDDCWTKEQWEAIIMDNSNMVKLVSSSFGLVGFWAAKVTIPENPDAIHDVELIKMGVTPKHRGQGLSRAILRDIRSWLQTDFVDSSKFNVSMLVPDSMLQPDWSSFIGKWLNRVGFRANKERMLVEFPHSSYGRNFQHAIRYDFPRLPGAYGL